MVKYDPKSRQQSSKKKQKIPRARPKHPTFLKNCQNKPWSPQTPAYKLHPLILIVSIPKKMPN